MEDNTKNSLGDSSDDDSFGESTVQLGVIAKESNALFLDSDWRNWDGGKIGGRPIWLDPLYLPRRDKLTCKYCSDPLIHLLQIYCPIDGIESAFHRCIYIFCCTKASCVSQGSFKCLRSQLPRVNPYYPYDPDQEVSTVARCQTCVICGIRGDFSCGKCKTRRYCSKSHQKLDWSLHKGSCGRVVEDVMNDTASKIGTNVLFPDLGVDVVSEELEKTIDDIDKYNIWEDAVTGDEDEEDDDRKIEQTDYNKALGTQDVDEEYLKFLTRIDRGHKSQVMRYCRWTNAYSHSTNSSQSSGVLLQSSSDVLKQKIRSVPRCEYCGAAREFEFQVMPQLLFYLNVDEKTVINESMKSKSRDVFQNINSKDIDWGSVDIYTCTSSCGTTVSDPTHGDAYLNECFILQPAQYRQIKSDSL